MSIGPGSSTKYEVTRAISEALINHTKYVSNLSLMSKYLIWRYTLGSGALNTTLIGIASDQQIIFWAYDFFRAYNYSRSELTQRYSIYGPFFSNPKSFLYDPNKLTIAKQIISKVIADLEGIILRAPIISKPFTVYKVSNKYPGLPDQIFLHEIVNQKPFNSSTYNPQFNFAPFIAPESACCLHKITIPRGSRVLMIPSEYHAYPHEMECLLPFGSSFDVHEITKAEFEYIPVEQQKFISVQDRDNLVIGQVYMIDPVSDNTTKMRPLTYYISDLINPT